MSTNEFEIPALDLDAAGKAFNFPVRASWMRGAFDDCDVTAAGPDGELHVRASKSGDDVVVHGTVQAELSVPCARCLAPTPLSINQAISALYVRKSSSSAHASKDVEFTSDEADVIPFNGETVVLDDLIRDELLLEVPMTPLCSEDCPGMSAQRGETSPGEPPVKRGGPSGGLSESPAGTEDSERPIDPRLAPLLRFMTQNEKNEKKE